MALIDDVKNEILARAAPAQAEAKQPDRPEKKKRHKTKEEIAAFVARKQAEEERRYLKLQGKGASKPEPSPKARAPKDEKPTSAKPAPAKPKAEKKADRQKAPKKAKGSCAKARPKTIKTIDLPDGGSLLLIYMPGPS